MPAEALAVFGCTDLNRVREIFWGGAFGRVGLRVRGVDGFGLNYEGVDGFDSKVWGWDSSGLRV